jgi:hypothetical protein
MVEMATAMSVQRRWLRTATGSYMRVMITWQAGEGKQGMGNGTRTGYGGNEEERITIYDWELVKSEW